VAGIRSPAAGAPTREIHLVCSWRLMGLLPCFQMVERTIHVAYNLDYPFHRATIQEHYAGYHPYNSRRHGRGRGVIPSISESHAIRQKEPGYSPSMIRFLPKGVHMHTKNMPPKQTRHGTLNPDDPQPAPITRGTEKPETLTTCHRHAENPNQHLPLTALKTENGGIGRVSTAHATTDWLALLRSPPRRSRSSVL